MLITFIGTQERKKIDKPLFLNKKNEFYREAALKKKSVVPYFFNEKINYSKLFYIFALLYSLDKTKQLRMIKKIIIKPINLTINR